MKNKRLLALLVIITCASGILCVASAGFWICVPDTAESWAIQETIQLSYKIEAYAAQTFDVSLFPTVFANDRRGGKLSKSTLELVRSVRKDAALTEDSFGFLDYKLAYFAWWEKGALQIESMWARAKSEGRDTLTIEESKSLVDASGRAAPPRVPTAVVFNTQMKFISVSIRGDIATAVCDVGVSTNKFTLIKKDGKWYIVGLRILSFHP